MCVSTRFCICILCVVAGPSAVSRGEPPLHQRIDELIAAKAADHSAAPPADDAEFLRRVYLDFAGRIPAAAEARDFLADSVQDKRTRLIDALLAGPEFPRRMTELFHVLLMERRGDQDEWRKFLRTSFAANKPWDKLAREILAPNPDDEQARGAAFFITKRLETYGQNPTDFPGLTRDIGRLFLGQDLQCAQCHDHLFIDDYKQRDFQGLFVVYSNASIQTKFKFPAVTVRAPANKLEFVSVFEAGKQSTGPRVPGGRELELPSTGEGDGQNLLETMAAEIARPDNALFARNAVNRLWFVMMGRGLVHPLDLHHRANPPSHHELLELLADEFVKHNFDIKWLLRELALTQTYQRASSFQPAGNSPRFSDKSPPDSMFLVAQERPLSAEQLFGSILQANGPPNAEATTDESFDARTDQHKDLKDRVERAFAAEPAEPEIEVRSSVKAALFLLNDERLLQLLDRRPGNLTDRLLGITDADRLAEELYLSILSRPPTADETKEAAAYLAGDAARREAALKNLIWALLSSAEFSMNH